MYMFQPGPHDSSHPLLSPLCPQVHFLHLCLYSCPANMFISTICLDSTFSSAQLLSHVQLSATPWTVARQATLSMEFSRQKYCSGHFLLQGSFPTQGSNLGLLYCRQILYCLSHQRSPNIKEEKNFPDHISACDSLFVCVCSVTQSCLTFCSPMDYSPPGSSAHGIF